jgi:hypothetical protein
VQASKPAIKKMNHTTIETLRDLRIWFLFELQDTTKSLSEGRASEGEREVELIKRLKAAQNAIS